MPDTTPPAPIVRKPRALPRVWQRFIHLEPNDVFFIGRCRYIKVGFLTAGTGIRQIRVWPWTRVQTDVLVRDARSGGKSSVVAEMKTAEATVDAVANSGRTHFVGDACPGGHADVAQPTSDNNVTGPTS